MARRPATQPSGLSREAILDAATAIARAEGIDALSMRRLAQALDVWPMSVYRYFQDKDALLDAMAGELARSVSRPVQSGAWRERMHRLLAAAAQAISGSPEIAARLPRAGLDPGGLSLAESGVAILLDAGLSPAAAASAWQALWSYTFGHAAARADSAHAVRAALAVLDEHEYPALAAVREYFEPAADEFAQGLDRLLDGIDREREALASGAPGSPPPAGTSGG